MHKTFVTMLLTIGLLTASVIMADPPPAPPEGDYQGGWGMCPENWENRSGSFEAFGIWRPGHDWVVGYTGDCNENPVYIEYDPISLDLWIELYCMQTYRFTHYQWHRKGDVAETIDFYICGIVSSNNPEWVGLMKEDQDLDQLHFVADIFGNDRGEPDIPIVWHYSWDSYDRLGGETPPEPGVIDTWYDIAPGGNGNMSFLIPDPCDHWFCWWGQFTINYHQADGHYQLHMAGCPSPGL